MLSDKVFNIARKIGRWSRFENEAKGTLTNISLEVRLTWTGSDVRANELFSVKVFND